MVPPPRWPDAGHRYRRSGDAPRGVSTVERHFPNAIYLRLGVPSFNPARQTPIPIQRFPTAVAAAKASRGLPPGQRAMSRRAGRVDVREAADEWAVQVGRSRPELFVTRLIHVQMVEHLIAL